MLDESISRRYFLKAAGSAAIIAAAGTLGCVGGQGSSGPTITPAASPAGTPAAASGKLVVATDADPVKLVDKALDAYGGLSGIIRQGDRVFVKANFSWNNRPEEGGCNNPQVLARIMQRCKEAGAGSVTAIDYTIDNGQQCLQNSGIKKAVEDAGLAVRAFRYDDFEDRAAEGVTLKSTQVPKLLKDCDALVNVPAVKSHGNALLSAGMKNLMGLIRERNALHDGSLDQNISDLAALFRPDLTIADAYLVVKNNGPRGSRDAGDLSHPQQVVVSDDFVAVDAYCTGYLDLMPEDVAHVRLAAHDGLGKIDLSKMNIIKV
ncbi:MAG TPA: DUF362 domain-containing protein [Methanocella sp.]|jgi:uncharacterized protein (DUF362 family)